MKIRINNEQIKNFPLSSKNVKIDEIKEKNNNFPKINIESSFEFENIKSNKLIHNPQQNYPNITINNAPLNKQNLTSSKKMKKRHLSIYNPLIKNNNFLYVNYMLGAKQNNNLNRNKISSKDILFTRQKSKNSILNTSIKGALSEQTEKANLKLIQKELQYKLLDMSYQIENSQDSEEELNVSNLINQKNKYFCGNNIKKELESYKKEIITNNSRRKSVNVNDFRKINNLSCYFNVNKEIKNNKNEYIKCKTNKLGINNDRNINSIKNEISNNKDYSNRKKSFIDFRNNISGNLTKKDNYSLIMNNNNKSMNLNLKSNITSNRNSFIFKKNNKSMCVDGNNANMISKMIVNAKKIMEYENKYRVISRNKELYDSLEDEEIIEELEEEFIFISPETHRIFIFDTFILICILFCSFYYPIYISQSICFCSYISIEIKIILFFTDFLTIFDIILSFFRAYYNFEYNLIKNNKKIVKHYLSRYFVPDLICGIPIFSISYYLCHKYNPDGVICFTNGIDFKYNFIKVCFGLKIIKLFKVLDKKSNRGINLFYEKISENYTLEKSMKMMLFVLLVIFGFNIFICYHIFIGRQTYPNWILTTNNQDNDFKNLYLISFYFLITTITSVGYGDITCVSLGETIFQIILLTIGVIAYSWVVSTIGNYVKKETRAAIKYNKDIGLLEEIIISYPKMSFRLYNKIQKHLETVSHQQERLDTNLLVNNLPFTLKNKIMFIIYENIIKKFKFFKECQNSDFILRVLTSYIPMSAKKNVFIIHEGELVDNIIFVKEGRLSLVAAIDLENPLISFESYLGEKFEDINDRIEIKLDNSILNNQSNIDTKIKQAKTEIKTFLKTKDELNESKIELEIGKRDFEGEDDFDVGNHQFLNILDILKNEHYGEVYMFLQKPSPLSLRVKSKYSELFLLRKHEAQIISKAYPNVWNKIYYKSYHNMKSIKKMTKQTIIHFCENFGYKYDTSKDSDINHISDKFLQNLGILNSKKGKSKKKKKFDLNGQYSQNNTNELLNQGKYPKKPNSENMDDNPKINKINFRDNYNNPRENNAFIIRLNGKKKNQLNQMYKMKTLGNNNRYDSNFKLSSKNNFSKTILSEHPNIKNFKNRIFSEGITINKLSNKNINNHFKNNINNLKKKSDENKALDLNSTSKIFSKFEDTNSKINSNKNMLRKLNSNAAVGHNSQYFKNTEKEKTDSRYISSKSFKTKKSPSTNINTLEKMRSIQIMNDANLNDNKIIQNKNSKNTIATQEIEVFEEKSNDKKPNTIKNLPLPLIKKIQKKFKKRRKKKKLYKMLISKLSESLIKMNPNTNLTILNSSINNSFINPEQKNENNFQLGYALQSNNNIINDNTLEIDKNEDFNPIKGQELLIIPESPEFNSESSSENSNSFNDSKSIDKEKIKLEFSISENINFSFNSLYDNLNIISDANYSKDVNLQKSVKKLIDVYLGKLKSKSKSSYSKNEISNNNINSGIINKKEKEEDKEIDKKKNIEIKNKNNKEKDKEKNNTEQNKNSKKEEEDVWAFLNDDEQNENEDINFKLNSTDSNESSEIKEKIYSKTPKGKLKKDFEFSEPLKRKSRFKKIKSNLLDDEQHEESINPKNKNKKKLSKKKTKNDSIKLKKFTTIIKTKKTKKHFLKNGKYKSNKNLKSEKNMNKKENNNSSSLNSFDLDINDEQKNAYAKNVYKTYQKKKKIDAGDNDKNNYK